MLAIIAPDHPAQIAVTSVAIILQHTARATVLLCDSVNSYLHKKAPFGAGLTIEYFGYRRYHRRYPTNIS